MSAKHSAWLQAYDACPVHISNDSAFSLSVCMAHAFSWENFRMLELDRNI